MPLATVLRSTDPADPFREANAGRNPLDSEPLGKGFAGKPEVPALQHRAGVAPADPYNSIPRLLETRSRRESFGGEEDGISRGAEIGDERTMGAALRRAVRPRVPEWRG